jgi:predicted DNA-binding transcriptional regulator YafY
MNSKMVRFNKIKSILRFSSQALTISEIHEGLTKRLGIEISRKTIERDLLEMSEAQAVAIIPGVPSRFTLSAPSEIELVLSVEEVKSILELIRTNADLYQKIKTNLENNGFRL